MKSLAKRVPWLVGVLTLVGVGLAADPAAGRTASAAEFLVRPGGGNKVVFASKASIEAFEGKTNRLEGRLALDPGSLGDSITVHLEVDLASLDTGIAKRNQHMRENHLETARYPKAIFDGATVHGPAGAKLEPGKPVTFDVEGTFTLHGVSRRLRIGAQATYTPGAGGSGASGGGAGGGGASGGGAGDGGTIAFRTEFPVALADYNISRPQFLFLKLAETQTVRVSGVATGTP